MIALLDNAASLHHQNAVGLQHSSKPMRDHQRRASGHHVVERALHLRLMLRVEGRRRLVKQEDRRILEDRARDGEPLPLPAGQSHATLPEPGLVTRDELTDKPVRRRPPRGGLDRGLADVSAPIGDVLGNRRAEDRSLLRHGSNALAQILGIDRLHIDPVDQDLAVPRRRKSA